MNSVKIEGQEAVDSNSEDLLRLAEFGHYLSAVKCLSPQTVEFYTCQCRLFLKDLWSRSKNLGAAAREDVESWMAARAMRGVSPNSSRSAFHAISHFMRYLKRKAWIKTNPAEDVELPRMRRRVPEFLYEREVTHLIENLPARSEDFVANKYTAMFLLFYATGARVAEIVGLRMKDLNLHDRVALVLGKGGKERWVPFSEAAAEAIRFYLPVRQEWLNERGYTSDVLFPGRRGQVMCTTTVRDWLKAWGESTSLGRRLHPHLLRHSCATHLLEGGADLRAIQQILGHASLASTQIYTHVDLVSMKKTYDRCHPQGAGMMAAA